MNTPLRANRRIECPKLRGLQEASGAISLPVWSIEWAALMNVDTAALGRHGMGMPPEWILCSQRLLVNRQWTEQKSSLVPGAFSRGWKCCRIEGKKTQKPTAIEFVAEFSTWDYYLRMNATPVFLSGSMKIFLLIEGHNHFSFDWRPEFEHAIRL